MNLEAEKRKIIDGVIQEQDEWVLKAIKKLLDLDYDDKVIEEHKHILNERIAHYGSNSKDALDWENFKRDLLK
jgi:urocanate hydratase